MGNVCRCGAFRRCVSLCARLFHDACAEVLAHTEFRLRAASIGGALWRDDGGLWEARGVLRLGCACGSRADHRRSGFRRLPDADHAIQLEGRLVVSWVSLGQRVRHAGRSLRPSLLDRLHRCRRDRRGRCASRQPRGARLGSAGVRQHPSSGADSRVRVLGRVVAAVGHAVPWRRRGRQHAAGQRVLSVRVALGRFLHGELPGRFGSAFRQRRRCAVRGLCLPGEHVPPHARYAGKASGRGRLGCVRSSCVHGVSPGGFSSSGRCTRTWRRFR